MYVRYNKARENIMRTCLACYQNNMTDHLSVRPSQSAQNRPVTGCTKCKGMVFGAEFLIL